MLIKTKENAFVGRQQSADYKITKKYERFHPVASCYQLSNQPSGQMK
jgi:hypothetical protein